MKASIAAKLDQLARRLEELNGFLATEQATRDLAEFRRLSREHAEITPIVERFNRYRAAESDRAAATEMLADPEMKAFAEAEAREAAVNWLRGQISALRQEIAKGDEAGKEAGGS